MFKSGIVKKKLIHLCLGVSKPNIPVKTTAPIIAQKTGKVTSPICITKISGKANLSANHVPITAPIKPTMTDIKHPPRLNPVSALPIEPVIPAIINNIINSKKDIFL